MARKKAFCVYGKLVLEVTTIIHADNLASAVEQSAKLREADFVDIPQGHFSDGSLAIVGVTEER